MRTRIGLNEDGAFGVALEPDGGDAGRLEPRTRPCVHIAPGCLLEVAEKIAQRRVPEGVRREVPPGALEERRLADERHELLEHRRALGVRDAVEVQLRCLEIVDVGDDRMRRGQLILLIRPRLAPGRERHPRIRKPRDRGGRVRAHVVGEGLLEPQVVPPAHRDEVAEPHVRHLMEDRVRTRFVLRDRRRTAEDVGLGEGDQSGVLHRADVVLGHEDLVVLAPRIRVLECIREEVEALAGDLEDLVGVEVLRE